MAEIFYSLLVWCIRAYRSIQMAFFRLLATQVERVVKKRFAACGITINGKNPWDPQVKNKEFYTKIAVNSSLGIGEAYVDGLWDCEALDQFCDKALRAGLDKQSDSWAEWALNYLLLGLFNLQTNERAFEVGEKHYDLGNDMFEAFLDPTMNYSCAYWKTATTLDQAQRDKMELVAKKLMLKPGMRVLEFGCGWGGLAKYLAENYKVQVVGCTVSKEQAKLAQEVCAGLPVEIRLADYRTVEEKFDRIVSVGMFEHVGPANYRTFFEVAHRCLKDDGIALVHTMGTNHSKADSFVPFTHTYLFPNVVIPYITDIPKATEGLFILEDWHNMGHDYSTTLMAWNETFIKVWPTLSHRGKRFFRLWQYYLLMSAGGFRARRYQLWQMVFSKNGIQGGYYAAR